MSTIDQQFVEYIVKTLVNNPDKVNIDRAIDEKGVLLSLSVDPEDVGRVIGRRGATAQSIRTLLRALGTKNDARYNLKIVNTDDNASLETTGEPTTARTVEDYNDSSEDSDLTKNTRAELADLDDLDI
ncbi:MAG: KH domain-containing protein [Candidatus Nanosyncoccus sp.]